MSAPVQLAEGSVFAGDYRVVRLLEEGGMGAVYVAEQLSTGKQRALKVMHPNLVHDARQRQRFVQEAKIGARIESDHVVEVLGAGVEPDSNMPWLVMELLSGETLDARLEHKGPLSRQELAEIFKQLCHAVAAAHDVGIVHRDLKPENIYLAVPRREGQSFVVKVLDFGIAKLVAESGSATQAIGSPLWMAPEQANVDAPISPATDVWALGLIAFSCLTGHSYWRGAHAEEPNPMTLVKEVCFEPLSSASSRAAEYRVEHRLPPGFDEWFAQCVARDLGARFSSAKPARLALERLLLATHDVAPSSIEGSSPSSRAFALASPDLDLPPSSQRRAAPDLDAKGPSVPVPASEPLPPLPSSRAPSASADAPPSSRPQPVSSLRASPPERIVIPPIKPVSSRREIVPAIAPAPIDRPFPWRNVGVAAIFVLAGLYAAQRFLWTHPNEVSAPAPVVAPSVAPPKASPPAPSTSAVAEVPCGPGMARMPGGDLVADDPTKSVASFCIDLTEVTVKAFGACVKAGKCAVPATVGTWTAITAAEKTLRNQSCNWGRADRAEHPINCVAHDQADAYCAAQGKRLPTENEWTWAARSGPVRYRFPWGSELPDVQLCWSAFSKRTSTCPVGQSPKGASSFGVLDLAGNVREWTSTSVGGDRVHCGSDWTDNTSEDMFKLGYCGQAPKAARASFLGFRCAK